MKKTILTITLAIFTLVILLLLTITNISAIDRTIFLDDYDIEYSYTSAEEDETFTLTISITNTDQDDQDKTEVVFELDEKEKNNIISQMSFYNVKTPYQIKNFWETRPSLLERVELQQVDKGGTAINENKNYGVDSSLGYGSEQLAFVKNALRNGR